MPHARSSGRTVGLIALATLTASPPVMAAAEAPPAPAPEARRLLAAERVGVLATQSRAMPGFPFASLTPYALDARGRPLILISTLSQHTINIKANNRVSLLVYAVAHPDVHDAPRLTWTGRAMPVGAANAQARTRYLARFPEAKRFFEAHDFAFYQLEPVRGYYIGGFGRIFWIEPRDLVTAGF